MARWARGGEGTGRIGGGKEIAGGTWWGEERRNESVRND